MERKARWGTLSIEQATNWTAAAIRDVAHSLSAFSIVACARRRWTSGVPNPACGVPILVVLRKVACRRSGRSRGWPEEIAAFLSHCPSSAKQSHDVPPLVWRSVK